MGLVAGVMGLVVLCVVGGWCDGIGGFLWGCGPVDEFSVYGLLTILVHRCLETLFGGDII